jgi:hypothetical protein
LILSGTNRREDKYQTEVTDFLSCQKPRALLNKEACVEIIIDKIKKEEVVYKYDEGDDVIVV